MITSKASFACLSYIVQGNCRPDGWEITAFASRNGICQRHHAFQVIVVMGSILAAFTDHRFMGQCKKPISKTQHVWFFLTPVK